MNGNETAVSDTDIAIIGMAARVPGSRTVQEFWANLQNRVEALTWLSDDDLRAAGIDDALLDDPEYVKAAQLMPDMEYFDAGFFGFSPLEASIMDPQHRHFLEVAWEAFERSGHDPTGFDGSVGVFAGCGMNNHFLVNLMSNPQLLHSVGHFLLRHTGNDKDFLSTRVSYLFNLTGPSLTVQTACSTSLVALHLACQSLLNGECDMALAGGATVRQPHKIGYQYREGEIMAPDGHCRPFDADAAGTTFGSGAAALIVRRLADALADGDHVHAVIKGSAINNDGAQKVGYLAPSVEGQARVVAEALAVAGVSPDDMGFVEAHGTGTMLGDPIEVAALTQAYRTGTDRAGYCALGSIKSNLGHLDTAAGAVSVMKAALALEHGIIPPTLHFQAPNPELNLEDSPFFVNADPLPWGDAERRRYAGVSSLGVGGTNAHVVLEQPPAPAPSGPSRSHQLLVLSGRTPQAADEGCGRLAARLREQPAISLADAAFTLQSGRRAFAERRAVVAGTPEEAAAELEQRDPKRMAIGTAPDADRKVVFSFAGGGAQYPGMARDLYETEQVFRETVDECLGYAARHVDADLRALMFPAAGEEEAARAQLERPSNALPALFTIQYAQARLWKSWGVEPTACVGHSMGEYTAACLAGVFSPEAAIGLVAVRGRLFEQLPEGAMLSVPLSEDELSAHLGSDLSIAAVNAPELCVASGPVAAIEALEQRLAADEIDTQRIHISVAAHSAMLEPILDEFRTYVRTVTFAEPSLPFASNLTGGWITPAEATDPEYWVRHLRQTVRFADGLANLLDDDAHLFLEVGPGRTLTSLGRLHPDVKPGHLFVNSIRHPDEGVSDVAFMLGVLGRLWVAGVDVDWAGFSAAEQRRRIPLPTYAFARERHWIEPGQQAALIPPADTSRRDDLGDWGYQFCWRPARAPRPAEDPGRVLVIGHQDDPLTAAAVSDLRERGHAVRVALAGDHFAETGEGYTVRPTEREDYVALIGALSEDGGAPARILHLLSAGQTSEGGSMAVCDRLLEESFYAPLALVQAWGEEGAGDAHLVFATCGMQSADGAPLTHPERAAILGPCRVARSEFPELTCRSVDVVPDGTDAPVRLARQLVDEVLSDDTEETIAWRAGRRLLQTHEPVRLEPPAGSAGLRREGVYLITGGLGGIGLTLAEHLASAVQARLILISRGGLPPRAEWAGWQAEHGPDDPTSRRMQAVAALEDAGADVLVVAADATDPGQLTAAVAAGVERFGRLDGVLHAAGVLDDGLILEKTRDAAAAVLAPKVHGTLALWEAVREHAPGLFLVFSSRSAVTGVAGQVDYAAASAYLNAFARFLAGQPDAPRTVSIGWSAWRDVGMAAELAGGSALPAVGGARPEHPMLDRRLGAGSGRDIFETDISTADHWMVSEHRIRGGEAVIPGTGWIELFRAAHAAATGMDTMDLRDVMFVAPFVVEDGSPRQLRIRFEPTDEGTEIVMEGRGTSTSAWQEHARGIAAPPSQAASVATPLDELLARCPRTQTFEGAVPRAHLDVGPRWQNVKAIHYGTGEMVVAIELPAEFAGDLGTYDLHPALLDVATGAGHRLVAEFDAEADFYVPASYGAFRMYAPLTGTLFSHIRYKGDDTPHADLAPFDITIMDGEGRTLAEVEEYMMVRVSEQDLVGGAPADTAPAGGGLDLEDAITPAEGIEIFRRIVGNATPAALVVSPQDLSAWLTELARQRAEPPAGAAPADAAPAVDVSPVEEALLRHDAIEDAAVTVHGRQGNLRILAHVVFDPDEDATVSELRRYLRDEVPEDLVPQQFLELDALPRNGKGTVDKSQLEDPFAPEDDFVAPRSDMEQVVAKIWQDLLGTDRVSIHDNFLDVGGHSLLALRALSRIKKETGVRLGPTWMNMHTLEQIAAELDTQVGGEPAAAAAG